MTLSLLENLFLPGTMERLGWMLVHVLWQATAVAILLAVFLRLLRHTSANIRYGAACSALALMVALPIITMRYIKTPGPVAEAGPAPRATALPAMPAPTPDAPPADSEHATRVEYWNDGMMGKRLADSLTFPYSMNPPFHSSPVPLRERLVLALKPALPYLVLGWLIGVFGLSAWHLGGWTQLQRLKRRMVREIGEPLQRRLEELSVRLGLHRAVGLLESALVEVPTVVGWLRPVILLPASALTGLRPEQLEAILAHELAHIRRYDYLVNMLQTVVEILGFYHPAIWWVSHRVRIERENCCDDLAVYVCGSSLQYAKALACMEEIRHGGTDLAVAATGGSLVARIARLLGRPAVEDRRFAWLPGLITLLLVVGLILPAALVLGTPDAAPVPPSGKDTTNVEVRETRAEAPGTARVAETPKPEAEAAPPQESRVRVARPAAGESTGSNTAATQETKAVESGSLHPNSDSPNPVSNEQAGRVVLSFKIAKVWSDLRPDREALLLLANALGVESPLAREFGRRGRQLDLTLGEVLKRYVAPQSLSQPAARALIDLLQSRGYLTMQTETQVIAQDNRQVQIRVNTEERFWMPPGSSKLERIAYETALDFTPHLVDGRRIALDMMVERTDPVPGTEDSNQPRVSRTSAETSMVAPNDRYLVWAAVESAPDQADPSKGRQSLYIMVKPVILQPAPGYAGPTGIRKSTETPLRQILLDVRTVTMERGALLNLGVEWSWPTVKTGAFPAPSAGGATSSGRANDWPYGVQIGYTPDRQFTDSLVAALDVLQKNGQARVSGQQILAQGGRQSRIKALTEEWFAVTAPPTKQSPQSHTEVHKTETGTVVTITPYVGDNAEITLEAAIEVSTSLPKARGSDLPLLTRRTAKNAVTIRDGGTVAVAGMVENRADPDGKSVHEMAIFVTAHLIPDVNEAALSAPQSTATPTRVPPAGNVSPEQQMLLRQEYVNSDPMVGELAKRIVETERELIVLRQKFASTHPTVVQKDALLEAYRQKLDQKRTELQEEYDRGLAERLRTATSRSSKEATVTATFTNTDLRSVLAEMSQRTGVKITPDLTVKTAPVTAELAEVPLETALRQILKNTPYTSRKLDDGTHLVFRPLSFIFPQVELAQALEDLSAAAGVPIIPDPNVMGPVNVTFEDVSLEEALQMLLAGKPYVFKKTPHYYLVAERKTVETRRIRLHYTQPSQAKQLVSPVFAPYVQVEPSRTQDPKDEGNTLIITAAPGLIDRIVEDIKQIDRPKRQVLLDARVAVMAQAERQNLGVQWSQPTPQACPPGAFTDNTTGGALTPCTRIGLTPDQTSAQSLMMALNMLQENHKADILSNPKIIAEDGRRAQMRIVQEEWFGPDARTNEERDLAALVEKTTSETVVAITPHIGDGNEITLDVAVEVNDVTRQSQGNKPQMTVRQMPQNSVRVQSGSTVVLAGLVEIPSKPGSRTPVLGDLPLIGTLFRGSGKQEPAKELVVFVTAHLVPDTVAMTPPAPESGKTAIPVPPRTRESGPGREGPDRSESPVPAANEEQVKPSVQVGARFVSADERLLRDLRGRGAIRGMTSPQETEALHEIGRRLSEGKSIVLTDEQAGLLMKATPQYRDCSMLAAPQVVVREDEPASLWIGSRIPYTAGYEEPNEPAGAPKPRQATLDSGLKFDTTAHLVGQNGVKLDGLLRMTTLLGFDKKKYQGRYPYQVPRTEDVVFSLDSPVVPSSGTSLTLGPKARLLKASDRPQTILILVTPSIVEGKPSR